MVTDELRYVLCNCTCIIGSLSYSPLFGLSEFDVNPKPNFVLIKDHLIIKIPHMLMVSKYQTAQTDEHFIPYYFPSQT